MILALLAASACRVEYLPPDAAAPATEDKPMPSLITRLSGPPTFRAGEAMRFTLTVEGPGKFCDYHTPFEGVRNAFMEIHRADGSEVPYAGMMAKRAAPGPENFITLKAGEKRSAEFDLAGGYKLEPGEYRLRFAGGSISGLPPSNELKLGVLAR
jgi:hypothetical protein